MNGVLEFLQTKENEMVEVLKNIVEKESPSLDKELTDQLGYEVKALFEKYTGGNASIISNDVHGNHIRGEWGTGDQQVLISAHFDTVWPRGTLSSMPFAIEEGKAYGPGAFDMKGGIVQGIFALHAIKELNKKLNKKIVFLFTSDEEIGSPTSQAIIEEEARKSEYVLVLEPAMSKEGAIKTARKGVGMFRLKVKGKPTHAGIDPEKGASAIAEIATQITYLHNLTNFNKGTTVNVGVVSGGTNSNVVAAEAVADIDLRVKTQLEFDRVIPLIKEIGPNLKGTEVLVEGGINRPPLERTEHVAELFYVAKGIAKQYLGIELNEKSTGGASDGNFTAPFAPTLDGLGAVGDGAHAHHEHVVISQLPVRSALLSLLLIELAKS
jgi:glutamate carboxypeptidase